MKSKDYNKIDLIFKAGLDIIFQDGMSGLTMAKLANKAGIATGTLYIYFKNKEILINQLSEKLKVESLERFLKGYTAEMPFYNALKVVWLNYLKHRIENYRESIFLEQYYRSPYFKENRVAIADSMKAPVLSLIQRGKDEGFLKQDVDNEMLFLGMLGFIRELADEHVMGTYKLSNEKIENAFQLSWQMIRI